MTGFVEKINFAKHSKKSTSQVKFDFDDLVNQTLP